VVTFAVGGLKGVVAALAEEVVVAFATGYGLALRGMRLVGEESGAALGLRRAQSSLVNDRDFAPACVFVSVERLEDASRRREDSVR